MTAMPETKRLVEALRQSKASMERISARLSEPLAVVGVGCRFPDCDNPEQYWNLLLDGRQVQLSSGDRWSESMTATHEKQPGRITANRGGFLKSIDEFDTQFFGISGREAAMLDPQQRLLLEIVWETFENAAIDPTQWRGRKVGAFVGICSDDYLHRLTQRPYESIDTYLSTGNSHGAAAGRLSYFMDWCGPAVAVDTACSSSLTALHLAARSLRYGDCEMAIVMGVNVILAPELSISLSQAGMLSPTGRCHSFSQQADGFARGEGCGGVLLKRLSKAEQDGDRILCLLRGTASNQDGRSNGLTAPNGESQQQVILAALNDAKLTPKDVDYIEAHGTGTPLGDPIEVGALKAVFANSRSQDLNTPFVNESEGRNLLLGSAKANLGHLEGAAGIAGVIKAVLALQKRTFPPHPSVGKLSERIDWDWPVKTPSSPSSWLAGERPRVAGVSSFGFGGSNAHAIFEEYSQKEVSTEVRSSPDDAGNDAESEPQLILLSAKNDNALLQQAANLAQFMQRYRPKLADVCYSAAIGRAAFEHRLAIVAQSVDDAIVLLERATNSGQLESSQRLFLNYDTKKANATFQQRIKGLQSLANRFLAGEESCWREQAVKPWFGGVQRIALPTYPFQRARRWFDIANKTELLGEKLDIADGVVVYETDLKYFQYLRDHIVDGKPVFPATGFLELAIAAGLKTSGSLLAVKNLKLLRPVLLHVDDSVKMQVALHDRGGQFEGRIHVKVGTIWHLTATFRLVQHNSAMLKTFNSHVISAYESGTLTGLSVSEYYQRAAKVGLEYGNAFRRIEELAAHPEKNGGHAYGKVATGPIGDCQDVFSPATLDACLQVAGASLLDLDQTWLPASVEHYYVSAPLRPSSSLNVYASAICKADEETLQVDVRIEQASGEVLAIVQGLSLSRLVRSNSKHKGVLAGSSPGSASTKNHPVTQSPVADSCSLEFLHAKVADIMGLTITEVPLDQPLDSLGMDSLMAFELRDELERRFQVSLPMDLFLEDITLRSFWQIVEDKVSLQPSEGWVEGEI